MSLRVAMVLHGWPGRRAGGTGMVVQALATALQELKHTVCIVAAEPVIDRDEAALLDIEVLALRPSSPRNWSETWSHPEANQQFEKLLGPWRPDIVHFHHLSGLSFNLIERANALGARTVLSLHDYAIPCLRGQLVTREGARCEGPSARQCAQCMTQLSPLGPWTARLGELARRIPGAERGVRAAAARLPSSSRRIERLAGDRNLAAQEALRGVDRLEAPSHDLCARIEAMGMRRPVHAPLPLVQNLHPAPRAHKGSIRFLFLGSFIPTKGPDRLLEAFSDLEPGSARLSLAGDEVPFFGSMDYLKKLKARAEDTPGVQWIGAVEPSKMQELLTSHDVLVLPSTWPENSPLVIREATAVGLRTIVGSIGGAAELDPNAQSVHPDHINELVSALRDEINRGPARNPSRRWPSASEVAQWHVDNSYIPASKGNQSTIAG